MMAEVEGGKVGGLAGKEGSYLLPVAMPLRTGDLIGTLPRTLLMTGVVTGKNNVLGVQKVFSILIQRFH